MIDKPHKSVDKELKEESDLTTETLEERRFRLNLEEDVKNLDRIEKWVVNIFPKLNFKSSNRNDEDNISYEESQDRLIAIGIFITMIPCLITIIQISQVLSATKSPRIIEPKIPYPSDPFSK